VLPLLLHPRIREAAEWPGTVAKRVGWHPGVNLTEVWRSYTTLTDRHAQMAFVNTVRSVIDVAGQRVSAHDRLYLASAVPTLIVWGDHDRIIPVAHAYRAAEAIPAHGSKSSKAPGTFCHGGTPTDFWPSSRTSSSRPSRPTCPKSVGGSS